MPSIGEILSAGLDHRLDSDALRMITAGSDDYSDLFVGNSYMTIIPTNVADARGICSDTPVPAPAICEYCGAKLYYNGVVMNIGAYRAGKIKAPSVSRWFEEPQRCTCDEAVRRWKTHDAEAERKRREDEERMARERHNAIMLSRLSRSGIRKRFQQRTFETFVADTPGRKRAYKMAKDYAESFESALATGDGLYIEGTNGTGKTHLAAAIGLCLTERGRSVVMRTSFDMLDEIKRAFDDHELSEHKILQTFKECDLLIIDDLGKEQCTEWSMSVLYSVINERYESMRPIVITTNFGSDDLIRTLTPRNSGSHTIEAIISRLREVSRTLTMDWADARERRGTV